MGIIIVIILIWAVWKIALKNDEERRIKEEQQSSEMQTFLAYAKDFSNLKEPLALRFYFDEIDLCTEVRVLDEEAMEDIVKYTVPYFKEEYEQKKYDKELLDDSFRDDIYRAVFKDDYCVVSKGFKELEIENIVWDETNEMYIFKFKEIGFTKLPEIRFKAAKREIAANFPEIRICARDDELIMMMNYR